ncbi:hypothetical protein HOP50_06g44820 [Chloropicon primus]|uniref:Uncharacterized protein n=1 Tax=Chloropicon primus TaxID=1764295 RepID=A0A5B8MNQ7_9CHLO|nr:hypothetical protein A3770_06p44590 [Chloropicon primus]UPR01161.1 hypothetical protein HOP50_06g44820 [Chloropicon primus]|mmetsp:Transcript_11751/g.32517  ORF Transcript_11751/g.32517 Transcript_11751/m.32517 type:complete len:220 (+) Transcript_11751:157-816(+)|eukprot:QDZ21941.1 hypothetical protein A3770_06p44590 [Chloropicon primus]
MAGGKYITQTEESMEKRVGNTALKEALESVGKAYYSFESAARPGSKGASEEEAKAKFLHLNNAIDVLELSFTKLSNASRAHKTDTDQYEDLRKKSGEESEAINRRIEEKKVELEDAKKVKAFYVECEKLKEAIVQIPSCSKLNKNIEETRMETEIIRENVGKMDELNERRRALLDTLLNSVGDLERSTEDPEKYDGIRVDPELIGAIREEAREALKEAA